MIPALSATTHSSYWTGVDIVGIGIAQEIASIPRPHSLKMIISFCNVAIRRLHRICYEQHAGKQPDHQDREESRLSGGNCTLSSECQPSRGCMNSRFHAIERYPFIRCFQGERVSGQSAYEISSR